MNDSEKKQIEKYIDECSKVIKSGNRSDAEKLQTRIISIFKNFIPKIEDGLDNYSGWGWSDESHQVDFLGDIELLKEKLEFFVNADGLYCKRDEVEKRTVNLNTSISNDNGINNSGNSTNTNTNTNNNTNTVNANFDIKSELDKARKELEENEYLDDDAKAEINEQLDQIGEVMNESSSNNEKWKKLKGVISWVASKGYKIGEMVMPIITKALFPEE